MSELLSSKVAEREEFNLTLLLSSRLEGVISSVQESILVIDKNSKLILQNFSEEQKTRIKGKKIKGYDIVDPLSIWLRG
jgi:transcriptional regulator with PAS, ATPase and Fis domain